MTQLDLFGAEVLDECKYPNHSGGTGWRYGCRCAKCVAAHHSYNNSPLSPFCQEEGCNEHRLKGRRYCANHPPGKKPKRVLLEAICEIPDCDRRITWYESVLAGNVRTEIRDLYRRVCGRHRRPYMGVISSHHLNTDQALELLLIKDCSWCGLQLVTLSSGRKDVVVDHDHACCSSSSCGLCVRGFVHPACNTEIGFLETVERGPRGLDTAVEYLRNYRERNRVATLHLV